MAAKRGRKPTKRKNSKTIKNSNKNISVLIMIIISILLGVLIFNQTGYIGKTLSPTLGGIMGWIKFIIPIGLFITAIAYACDKKEFLSSKMFELIVFLVCVCTILSIYQISEKTLNIKDGMSQIISGAYDLGTKNIGGGAIGTIIAVPLINMLGIAGAVIVSIGIGIVTLVFVLGIPVSDIIQNFIESMKEKQEERKEEVNEYRQQEYERRQKLREERKKQKGRRILQDVEQTEITEDQIKINLHDRQGENLKKYDHSHED